MQISYLFGNLNVRGGFGKVAYIRFNDATSRFARYTCSTYNVSDALGYRFDGSTADRSELLRERKKTSRRRVSRLFEEQFAFVRGVFASNKNTAKFANTLL